MYGGMGFIVECDVYCFFKWVYVLMWLLGDLWWIFVVLLILV